MKTAFGEIETLDVTLPVFLPGTNRDWSKWAGIARITDKGEILVQFTEPEAGKTLVDMAINNILLQLSFDYKLTDQMIKSINERFTKKYTSNVGTFAVTSKESDVGTATLKTDGTIELNLENEAEAYTIDTTKKIEKAAIITTPIEENKK